MQSYRNSCLPQAAIFRLLSHPFCTDFSSSDSPILLNGAPNLLKGAPNLLENAPNLLKGAPNLLTSLPAKKRQSAPPRDGPTAIGTPSLSVSPASRSDARSADNARSSGGAPAPTQPPLLPSPSPPPPLPSCCLSGLLSRSAACNHPRPWCADTLRSFRCFLKTSTTFSGSAAAPTTTVASLFAVVAETRPKPAGAAPSRNGTIGADTRKSMPGAKLVRKSCLQTKCRKSASETGPGSLRPQLAEIRRSPRCRLTFTDDELLDSSILLPCSTRCVVRSESCPDKMGGLDA
eukprot:2341693-Pleurochrysis_carterae.AAC.1